VERNVAVGDITDPNTALFVIADLRRLAVVAYAPEADLPALRAPPAAGRWLIRPRAEPDSPAVPGRIEGLGVAVDPQTHTVLVRGWVENAGGLLRPGQLVTATIRLAAVPGEVAVPASALVQDGGPALVFVQPDSRERRYELRRVVVVRRGAEMVHVRCRPGPAEARQGFGALRPGERVVTAGAVALKALLDDLRR
jgi:multidrug efflux pump subunit AcrA (membrane-fusion protein)